MVVKDRHVLVDTCIFNNLHSKQSDLASETSKLLEGVVIGNSLYFSEFTRHELFRGATKNKQLKIEASLSQLIEVPSTAQRLMRATQLYSAYKNESRVATILHSLSDIDIFIGALLFHKERPLLLTADYHDFPRPFFVERKRERIEFGNNRGAMQSLYYYFLEADLEAI